MTTDTRSRGAGRRSVIAMAFIAVLAVLSGGSVQAETLTVAAVNFRFEPESRTASVGDVVRWTFAGDPHTVTSGAPGSPDGVFDSGVKNPGESYQLTLTTAGTLRYFCAIHPEQMFGTIVVGGGSDPTPRPTVKPTATLTARPTARPTVRPTPAATAAPTPVSTPTPTETPEQTALASASAGPSSTPTATATSTPSSPAAGADESGTPGASAPPGPGTAASSVDPAPIVAAVIVLVALVGGGLALARRSGRV